MHDASRLLPDGKTVGPICLQDHHTRERAIKHLKKRRHNRVAPCLEMARWYLPPDHGAVRTTTARPVGPCDRDPVLRLPGPLLCPPDELVWDKLEAVRGIVDAEMQDEAVRFLSADDLSKLALAIERSTSRIHADRLSEEFAGFPAGSRAMVAPHLVPRRRGPR